MRKTLLMSLLLPILLSGCPGPTMPTDPSASATASPNYNSDYQYPTSTASASPSASAMPSSPPNLSSLQAGIVPDTSLSEQERKLAGLLVRETVPVFPLKIGVFLYRSESNLQEEARKKYFEQFIKKLQDDPNIGQVTDISPKLINANPSLEEIRNLGARFQVSSILVINERYDYPIQSKQALVTPIDYITGNRTWESFSSLEVYSLDILNGIFIFSISNSEKMSDKYSNKTSSAEDPGANLIKLSAEKTWTGMETKVIQEYNNYKTRLDSKTTLPVVIKAPLPQLAVTK